MNTLSISALLAAAALAGTSAFATTTIVTKKTTTTTTTRSEPVFDVALIGDLPYIPANMGRFLTLRDQINRSDVKFVIHDGDFKSGGSLCSDEMFKNRYDLFNSFEKPFFYVPGDNEWTDCHRESNGSYDPLERLSYLRKMFFKDDQTLGKAKLTAERQGVVEGTAYPENFRFTRHGVQFTGLHIIGSNNNLGRNKANDREYEQRNKANLAWLKESYAIAKRDSVRALVIVIQANPHFEKPAVERTGFNDFIETFQALAQELPIPTLFVHGDTHQFQVNKPFPVAPGEEWKYPRWPHVTRLETYGSPNVHWIKLRIDLNDPWPFWYKEMPVYETR